MSHIMLSYQWDSQELVKKVNSKLKGLGLSTWMDIDAMSGEINSAMAEAVEGAVVLVPFMTQKYMDSKNCKKELSYGDQCDKAIVPCMAQQSFKASGWLGLITAGMLWMDFRNANNIDKSIESLVKEITATCGSQVAKIAVSVSSNEAKILTTPQKGRAFIHISTNKYLAETGQVKYHPASGSRNTLTTRDSAEDTSFWVQEKGNGGIVYFKNYHTDGYLGYDPNGDYVYTKAQHYGAEEWIMTTNHDDDTGRRAVVIFANYGKKYLTVRNGKLTGVPTATRDCIWYLH